MDRGCIGCIDSKHLKTIKNQVEGVNLKNALNHGGFTMFTDNTNIKENDVFLFQGVLHQVVSFNKVNNEVKIKVIEGQFKDETQTLKLTNLIYQLKRG